MEEPSVLDYVKSKLAFWKHSSIEIPEIELKPDSPVRAQSEWLLSQNLVDAETESLPVLVDEDGSPLVSINVAPQARRPVSAAPRSSGPGLLLVIGALVLALVAQSFLEPPNRDAFAAGLTYAIAAALLGVAYFRNFIRPADGSIDLPVRDPYTLRKEGLLIGAALMIMAFVTFFTPPGKEVPFFNFFNTSLWLLSIAYLAWGFYLPSSEAGNGLVERARRFLTRPTWKISVTRWTLLLLAVIAVILFFRFYRLDNIIPEMVSDHAEKLLDVNDVLHGEFRVFFPRNTGREAFQFYWTALMVKLFNTGISFMALKLGTSLIGLLTLYYMYKLGVEIANRWVGLFAVLFCGFSYWGIIISRIGLRFPLYAGFYAPMLFYLIRGLRRSNRNDFIWAGIWLGIGLHGYTSYRIVPFIVVACVLIYLVHHRSSNERLQFALAGLIIVAILSLAVFVPLLRFTFDDPNAVALRSLTRISTAERPLPGSPVDIFFQNSWNALTMFFWGNGDVWVHSIPYRPALDVISAALFFLGVVLVALRYVRKRSWVDLFMLVSIPLLLLPSILSLAFPNENPNLNRTSAAYVPAFLILGMALDALLRAIRRSLPGRTGLVMASALGLMLAAASAWANYDLVFNQYDLSFRSAAWNTSEMGAVVKAFDQSVGQAQDAWVLAFPYWVDTRLVGMNAGFPTRDTAITVDQLAETQSDPRIKLFLVNREDVDGLNKLQSLYPDGRYSTYRSRTQGKDFLIFLVPAQENEVSPPLGGLEHILTTAQP